MCNLCKIFLDALTGKLSHSISMGSVDLESHMLNYACLFASLLHLRASGGWYCILKSWMFGIKLLQNHCIANVFSNELFGKQVRGRGHTPIFLGRKRKSGEIICLLFPRFLSTGTFLISVFTGLYYSKNYSFCLFEYFFSCGWQCISNFVWMRGS